MAVFPSGNLLISGLEYDHDRKNSVMWPFTGIFGSDGALLKEVKLEDDDAIHDMALSGDQRVSSFTNPSANHAVEFSKMEAGADGNIFLMRWLTPAIFYAISPGGAVVRRFTVDPGDQINLRICMFRATGLRSYFFNRRAKRHACRLWTSKGKRLERMTR